MHRNVILTNKRCTHTQPNYTNTKLKAWFRPLLRHLARKRSGPILHRQTHTEERRWDLEQTMRKKKCNHLFMSFASGFHQRRVSLIVGLLEVCSSLNEQVGQLHVAAAGRQRQRRLKAVGRHVHLQCSEKTMHLLFDSFYSEITSGVPAGSSDISVQNF